MTAEKPEGDVALRIERFGLDPELYAEEMLVEIMSQADALESQSRRMSELEIRNQELEKALRAVIAADNRVTDFGMEGALRLAHRALSGGQPTEAK